MLRSTMNVTRSGSVRRPRSSFAARPTATRSRDSSSASASASEIRSPSSAFSRIAVVVRRVAAVAAHDRRLRRDEAQLGHLVELAALVRQLEEREQPGALARPEAVAQLLEVAGEEAGRVAVALGGLVREPLGFGARGAHRRDERVLELGEPGDGGSGAAQTANTIGRPVRSSHSRPRSWCGVGSSNADLQRRVADQQLRVGVLAERHVLRVGQQHLRRARPTWRTRA